MSGNPKLTIVVVPFAGEFHLQRCLKALDAHPDCEIIVARDGQTPAARRANGIRAARAPIVAVLEDHVVPAPGWTGRVLEAHQAPHAAIGGAIAKLRPATNVAWALWLADFSRYAPNRPPGPAASLSDIHVTYKREALDRIGVTAEFHEHLAHTALAGQLWFDPSLLVDQDRSLPLFTALSERFEHARLYGATRPLRPAQRLILIASAPLLPILLIARSLYASAPLPAKLFALPALVPLCIAWAAGEWLGAVLPSKLPEA